MTVLGSGASFPGSGHACSGYLLESGGTRVMLECGSGSVANAAAVTDAGVADSTGNGDAGAVVGVGTSDAAGIDSLGEGSAAAAGTTHARASVTASTMDAGRRRRLVNKVMTYPQRGR